MIPEYHAMHGSLCLFVPGLVADKNDTELWHSPCFSRAAFREFTL